jgi:hypothetical protein
VSFSLEKDTKTTAKGLLGHLVLWCKRIILDLRDERRIMGWPAEWPNDPEKGHFVLENAAWLIKAEDATGGNHYES